MASRNGNENGNGSSIPSIDSLHKERHKKDTTRNDMYTIVLNKCIEKIIHANRHTDKTYIVFEVPNILIGYPMYNMKSCILFIINQLVQKQYLVEFIEPHYLYIDWGCKGSIINKSSTSSQSISHKLQKHTQEILKRYPKADIEFVLEDDLVNSSRSRKKNKKRK